jgi:hypothetical protein
MKLTWMTNAAGSHHRFNGWPPYWLGPSNLPRENSKINLNVSLRFFGALKLDGNDFGPLINYTKKSLNDEAEKHLD